MTLQISIIIPDDREPRSYLEAQMAALGFYRQIVEDAEDRSPAFLRAEADAAEELARLAMADTAGQAAPPPPVSSAKRERGKPCPLSGRQRRSRQEVEEDEAAEAAEQAAAGQEMPTVAHHVTLPEDTSPEGVAKAFNELRAQQQISTGEERVDPAAEPETAAADIFAEAAPPKTLEDVKKALGAYVTAYGMAPAQTDGQLIFRQVLGEPPAGEQAWRMTLIPAEGGKYDAVVAAIESAIKLNPYKRERTA